MKPLLSRDIMTDKYVEILGMPIRYKSLNENARNKIIFIHGLRNTADIWDMIGTLSRVANIGYAVYALDLPGFGKSGGRRLRIKESVEFLKEFIHKLEITYPVLVGHSIGGGLALRYAIKNPDKTRALVLIAPAETNYPDIIAGLPVLSMPILVFWGKKDKMFSIKKGKELVKKLKNARLIECPKAGHECHIDAKELFNEKLIEFLRSI